MDVESQSKGLTPNHDTETNNDNSDKNESDNKNGCGLLEKQQETEGLLKLNPYPVLDTDPPLNSPQLTKTHVSFRATANKIQSVRNEVDPVNVNKADLQNVDRPNNTTIENYDVRVRQPSSAKQRRPKLVRTVTPRSLVTTKTTHGRRDETIVNRVRTSTRTTRDGKEFDNKTNETLTGGERNADDGRTDPKRKTVPNQNGNQLNRKDNSRTGYTNSSNNYAFGSSAENTQNSIRSSIAQKINTRIESNKSTVDHSISDNGNMASGRKYNCEQHSGLRRSLFTNVPPYIRFSLYDTKGESFPLVLQKLLKWKLSSVTPIVVRRTVENSGFKLVRSEHSLNTSSSSSSSNSRNPSAPTGHSKRCEVLSVRGQCDVTPPIVDDFCGAVAPTNELMMLLRTQSDDWVGTWGAHMKSACFKGLCGQQKFNHFPGTFQIGRKDRLWKNLYRLMLKYGDETFGFIPRSYILPREVNTLRPAFDKNPENKWIIKPPASARGSGIHVVSKWNEIPKNVPLVVQLYIDNPYLINGTKFDLRLYILVTSVNPLRLYLYDNGLVRFASVEYSPNVQTITDRYMHLTNYSINRLNRQYTKNEDADACQGHKWTLQSLWTYMEKERQIDVKKLRDSLADLAVKTVISGEPSVNQTCLSNLNNRYNAYELFGIDVLLDEYLKPWILEVNISPSLHSSSKLDLAVKGPLIRDLMNMVGYRIPDKLSPSTNATLLDVLGCDSPLTFDRRLYALSLSDREREKQQHYANVERRENYVDSILDDLLPDDVRHLVLYEDELSQIGSYHQYFDDNRYYNMLLDAWENKYSDNREDGIAVLENLCRLNVHLEVPGVEEQLVDDAPPNVLTD